MAMKKTFQVKPVTRYDGARYPSFVPEQPEEEKAHPVVILLCLVLVMGLSLGVIGCFSEYKWLCDDGLPPDQNGDCPGDDPECLPGLVICRGETGASICNDDGQSWNNLDCLDYCGPDAIAVSCDSEAAYPCQCEYDIIDGGIGECFPGEMTCKDEITLSFCDEDQMTWVHQDCQEYCQENYGQDYYTMGCDTGAEDPCQCHYDIMDGTIAECTPGEFYCSDEYIAQVCDEDGWSWNEIDCNEFCKEEYGEHSYSEGCDDQAGELCQCYGIVDGEPLQCTPGDFLFCQAEDTATVCDDNGWDWIYVNCSEYCEVNYGPDSESSDCDDNGGDNFCGCS
jgi:hypothetical protein